MFIQTNAAETELVNNIEELVEKVETNGIASSREPSVESEKKANGTAEDEVVQEVQEEVENTEEAEEEEDENATPSEDLIRSEQEAAE